MRKLLCLVLAGVLLLATPIASLAEDKLNVSIGYYDNPTYPFNPEWITFQTAADIAGLNVDWQPYPLSEYITKVTTVLAGGNAPDAITNVDATKSTYAQLSSSGVLLPVSDYFDCFPNFMARIEEFGLTDLLKIKYAADGKLYFLPKLQDTQVYNAGMLIRTDLLEEYGLERPTSYDELYEVLKVFKEHNPDKYPLTCYLTPEYIYLWSMPSWGINLGAYNSSSSYVLSWDYANGAYFAGATSDACRDYLRYMNKLYAEGLLDPEWFSNPSDRWTTKLATGESFASFGYYDQIGGIVSNSTVDGIALDMLTPLAGPAGAHTRPSGRLSDGVIFPASVLERADYKEVLMAIDKLFYSEETSTILNIGLEGETYDVVDGKIVFKEALVNNPNGLFKALQVEYGCVTSALLVRHKAMDLLKMDAHYTDLNNETDAMGDALQDPPALPKFNEDEQEDASLLVARLSDAFDVWSINFISGASSLDSDWDAYVAEMESKGISTLLEMYNTAMANQ